jgi:hypothetical protein
MSTVIWSLGNHMRFNAEKDIYLDKAIAMWHHGNKQ